MVVARKLTKPTKSTQSAQIIELPRNMKQFEGIPIERIKNYGRILERTIREEFGGATSFTREDLIHLSTFSHISTISRYRTVGIVVHYLIRRGVLIAKDWTNLCLVDNQDSYISIPLQHRFYNTIRTIVVRKFHKAEHISVMDIVGEWKTDQELTVNNKRVAVRGAIRQLLKDNVITKYDEFEYIVRG